MNYTEVGTLLGRVKLGDNREIDEKGLMIEDWFQTIGHLPYDECLAAVVLHRQEKPGVWLEPGHIIAGVRILRAKGERQQRIAAQLERTAKRAITGNVITLDYAQHEIEFQAALAANRAAKA